MALFSSDLKRVINEGKAAGGKRGRARLAAVKAGHKPRYCPPEGGNGIGSDEYMKGLAAIPAAERARIDMTEATTRILAAQIPLPAPTKVTERRPARPRTAPTAISANSGQQRRAPQGANAARP